MALGVMILVAGSTMCGAACAEGGPDLRDPKAIAAGRDLFLAKQCAHCHGEAGAGGVNLVRRKLDPAGVFGAIADGREKNGIRMPAWREVLTDDEIWQATAFVLSISQPTTASRESQPSSSSR